MRTRLALYWDYLRSSYWFVPTLMAVLALIAASAAVYFDILIGDEWIDDVPFLYRNEPSGARHLLSTVAGSMIGVAGVTFSITIVSVVYASGHYGPRVLSNFMADKGNQLTLGTFIATFLYCLMVLRTVRAADESSVHGVGAFVPHIAITLGLLLAVASIAVLIYFIHHVPHSIHVSQVVADIGRELAKQIDTVFPEEIGSPAGDGEEPADGLPPPDDTRGFAVDTVEAGFLQSVDGEGLLELARAEEATIRILKRPGDFVGTGDALAEVAASHAPTEEVRDEIREAFTIGTRRTALQDVRFPADELVEIAVRALSPGINDPFTAIACIGWLTSAYKKLAARRIPSQFRRDDDGAIRLVAPAVSFEEFVDGTLSMLMPHARRDPSVHKFLVESIHEVLSRTNQLGRRAILESYSQPGPAGRSEGGGDSEMKSIRAWN